MTGCVTHKGPGLSGNSFRMFEGLVFLRFFFCSNWIELIMEKKEDSSFFPGNILNENRWWLYMNRKCDYELNYSYISHQNELNHENDWIRERERIWKRIRKTKKKTENENRIHYGKMRCVLNKVTKKLVVVDYTQKKINKFFFFWANRKWIPGISFLLSLSLSLGLFIFCCCCWLYLIIILLLLLFRFFWSVIFN